MKKYYITILVFHFALQSFNANATMHNIAVGSGGSNAFIPASITVFVGDTICWTLASGVHSVTATSIPAGANNFNSNTMSVLGTQYFYPVTFPGTYNYHCVAHNETGTFTAIGLSTVYANFTIVPDSTYSLSCWTFNSSVGNILSYIWDFGDGATSVLQSPTHIYSATGTYTVCLKVTDSVNTDSICHSLTLSSVPNSCMALFDIAVDTTSLNPNAFIITDLSYGNNLSYLWDFGDSTTSTALYPTHNYSGVGPYRLCLTVDDGAGCVQTYCDSLFAVDTSSHSLLHPIFVKVVGGPSSPFSLGINEKAHSCEVTISPNPFTTQTTITFSTEQKHTILYITDVTGRMVNGKQLMVNGKTAELDMSDVVKGIYFVRIEDENKNVVNRKIVVE